MATPLQDIIDISRTFTNPEFQFPSMDNPRMYAKVGVTQASIFFDKDYTFTTLADGSIEIDEDLTAKEVLLCGLYAYRNFALAEHHRVTENAINFKTINFALTGMTERAKEYMRIIWWCNGEIEKIEKSLTQVYGSTQEMRGE